MFFIGSHDDIHGHLTLRQLLHAEPGPQVNGRDDLPSQVDQPANHRRRQRNPGHLLIPENFLNVFDLDAEKKIPEAKEISPRPEKDIHRRTAGIFLRSLISLALVVDKILDIVEENITVERGSNRKGTLGTVVVQGLVTDLLDAEAIVRENDPTFYDEQPLATV